MKRQDIVNKLLSEGFSEKTLVNFSDKQLEKLTGMISEQTNIEKGAVRMDKTKTQPSDVKRYTDTDIDVELSENEDSVDEMKSEYAKLKNKTNQFKKDGKKIPDEHKRKMADLAVAIRKKGAHEEPADIDESGRFFTFNKKRYPNQEKKDKDADKKVKDTEVTKKKSISEWVDQIANKKYTSLTSKKEIMEMVATKVQKFKQNKVKIGHNGIPEFMTYDAIKASGGGDVAEPTTKPKTRPTTQPGTNPNPRPTPKTPYRPGPGTNPKPKARALGEDVAEPTTKPKTVPVTKPGTKPGTNPRPTPKTPYRPGPGTNPKPKAMGDKTIFKK